jgi:hypothetical protein
VYTVDNIDVVVDERYVGERRRMFSTRGSQCAGRDARYNCESSKWRVTFFDVQWEGSNYGSWAAAPNSRSR